MVPSQGLKRTFKAVDEVEGKGTHGNYIKRDQYPVLKSKLHLLIQIFRFEHLNIIVYVFYVFSELAGNQLGYGGLLRGQICTVFYIRHVIVVVLPPEVTHVGNDKHQ